MKESKPQTHEAMIQLLLQLIPKTVDEVVPEYAHIFERRLNDTRKIPRSGGYSTLSLLERCAWAMAMENSKLTVNTPQLEVLVTQCVIRISPSQFITASRVLDRDRGKSTITVDLLNEPIVWVRICLIPLSQSSSII